MIALIVHSPKAHLREVQSFNAVLFFFSHWQNSQEKKKKQPSVYFSCWVVRRKGHEAKGLPLRQCSAESRPHVPPRQEMRAPVGSPPLLGELCACWGDGGQGTATHHPHGGDRDTPPRRETLTPCVHTGLKTSCKMSCGHCPVQLLSSFNASEY